MPTQLAQWNGKKKYGIKIIMANSNNNSIIPNLGRISLDTVFDFFHNLMLLLLNLFFFLI